RPRGQVQEPADQDRTPHARRPPLPLGDGGVDVRAAVHGVPAGGRREVRVGAVALDGRSPPDGVDPVPRRARQLFPRLLVDLGRAARHPRAEGGAAARAGPRRPRAEVGQVPARQPALPPRHRRRRVRRHHHRAADDSAHPHRPRGAQPVLPERRHLGAHLRHPRPGRRRPGRPGDRARLLRRAAGEVVDHQVDDLRLDYAAAVPRAPRTGALAGQRRRIGESEAGGPGVSGAEVVGELTTRINTIEEAYEFMLAYASQGLSADQETATGRQAREFLVRCSAALDNFGDFLTGYTERLALEPAAAYRAFISVIDRDARDAQAAIQLVLAQRAISSQLVDNLNASIHLRALLTDLFLIDEVLKGQRASS